ncbi:MAG: replication-associated recombination protein A, partial [Acidimicrobiales bacterium]
RVRAVAAPPARNAPGLFEARKHEQLALGGPLAARLRPGSLDEVVGQEHLLGPGRPLRVLAEQGRMSSCILWGPPGSGKTTVARLLASAAGAGFVSMSATEAGVAELRSVIAAAAADLGELGRATVVFVDEVHRFSRSQQDVLLPAVEDGIIRLVGATTENPFFALAGSLLSRAALFRLEPLRPAEIEVVLTRALEHEGATAEPGVLPHLSTLAGGDARAALGALELALSMAGLRAPPVRVLAADAEAAKADVSLRGGADQHYDLASALIKSVRGSDADAGLYWLARMLQAGEDPRFVARRLVILASEDVGMADPSSLLVADAAARAVEAVGMPEASLALAQATVHLALAPKSNRVTVALQRATEDARGGAPEVPAHLRDAHYPGAAQLGHGAGYQYPHDHPGAVVRQAYRPVGMEGRRYYEPSGRGAEADAAPGAGQPRRGQGPGERPGFLAP